MSRSSNNFEVIIVGAGISGAALAYELARYTNVESIAIVEKYEDIATLNTKGTSNSQTIHVGDIETNYTLEKAAITKRTAKMVELYCLEHKLENKAMFSHQKMALGVGEEEVEFLLQRYEEFSELFPYLEVWDKDKLKELDLFKKLIPISFSMGFIFLIKEQIINRRRRDERFTDPCLKESLVGSSI